MKLWLPLAVALVAPLSAHAQARKPCEQLKSEIAKNMDAKGVTSYTLDIVDKDKDTDGKVVGTCDGNTKKIVYRRGAAPDQAPPKP